MFGNALLFFMFGISYMLWTYVKECKESSNLKGDFKPYHDPESWG